MANCLGLIDDRGVHGEAVVPLPWGIAKFLGARARSPVMAASTPSSCGRARALALRAQLADPLTPSITPAEAVLDDALVAHLPSLPCSPRPVHPRLPC